MALSSFVGQFSTGTATGSLAITGVGFTPKLVLFWGVAQTADGQGASYQPFFGAASGTTARFAVAASSQNGLGTTVVKNEFRNDRCIFMLTAAGTGDLQADLVSFDADGFTINRINAAGSSWKINFLALGGSDLANVIVGSTTMAAGTGSASVAALGFQPNLVLFGMAGTTTTTSGSAGSHRGISVGWAASSSARACAMFGGQNGVALTTTGSLVSTTKCMGSLNSTASSLETAADFVSMDAGGFTYNKTAGGSTTIFGYIAISVTNLAVGTTTAQTGNGNFSVGSLGFQPSALLMLLSDATATQTAPGAGANWGMGGASASSARGAIWIADANNVVTSSSQQRQDSTKCYSHYSDTTPFTVVGEGDFVSFDSGGFTLNQTTADAALVLMPYVVMGGAAVASSYIPIDLAHQPQHQPILAQ